MSACPPRGSAQSVSLQRRHSGGRGQKVQRRCAMHAESSTLEDLIDEKVTFEGQVTPRRLRFLMVFFLVLAATHE